MCTSSFCFWNNITQDKFLILQWKLLSFVIMCDHSLWSHVAYLPVSSVHGILQARILEWVAVPFSRESSQPRNWTQVSSIAGEFFTIWATRITGVGSLSLLPGIFLTQELNRGLLHCRATREQHTYVHTEGIRRRERAMRGDVWGLLRAGGLWVLKTDWRAQGSWFWDAAR